MGQYINFCMEFKVTHEHNRGLRSIIEYIGLREYPAKACKNDKDQLYKLGKKFLNSKLNKWHLTAMERLVRSTHTSCACDQNNIKRKVIWKIHRRKAKMIFKKIGEIISNYDDAEIIEQFHKIKKLYFIGQLTDNRSELIGSPYYRKIADKNSLVANQYSAQDIEDLTKVAKEISRFSK